MKRKCQKNAGIKRTCVGNLAICFVSNYMVCDRLVNAEKKGPQLISGERGCAGYEEDTGWATIVWCGSVREKHLLE